VPRSTEQLIETAAFEVTRRVYRVVALLLPWSGRSQHDAWRAGYLEGLQDALTMPSPE